MGSIDLHYGGFTYNLPIQRNSYSNFTSQSSGSRTIDGITYTTTKTQTNNYLTYNITLSGSYAIEDIDDFLNNIAPALGFGAISGCAAFDCWGDIPLGSNMHFTGTLNTGSYYYEFTMTQNPYTMQKSGNIKTAQNIGAGAGDITQSICCLVAFQDEDKYYFGFVVVARNGCTIVIDKTFTDNNSGVTVKASSGEKGFRPIESITKNTIGGGTTSGAIPGYSTDVLTQPGAPNESVASAIGSGFINVYKLDTNNLVRLGKCLFDGLIAKLTNIFMNPMDSIVSLQVFPCTPDLGATEYIKVLQYTCIAADLSEDSQGTKLSNQFKVFDFGTLYVAEMWNSFLDYDATSFELYLPFIGAVDISVGEVMNGSINVQYTVDFLTGMCVANVLCTKTTTLSSGATAPQYSQHSFMGNCSVTIPLHNESWANIVGSLAQAASAGLRGGVGAAAGSLAMSAISGGFKPNIETKGTVNSNAGFCAILQPYITVNRPITAESYNYQEVIGYPSYITATLGECEDLCVCDDIDLSGVTGATDSEIEKIRSICRDGIYI